MFSRGFFHGSNFRFRFCKGPVPMFGSFVSSNKKKIELESGSQELDIELPILTLEIGYPPNTSQHLFLMFSFRSGPAIMVLSFMTMGPVLQRSQQSNSVHSSLSNLLLFIWEQHRLFTLSCPCSCKCFSVSSIVRSTLSMSCCSFKFSFAVVHQKFSSFCFVDCLLLGVALVQSMIASPCALLINNSI